MKRQPSIIVAFGQRGSGKTDETIEELFKYAFDKPRRNVLIFDVNDEFGAYRSRYIDTPISSLPPYVPLNYIKRLGNENFINIPSIDVRDLENYSKITKPQIRRIRPYINSRKVMNLKDMQVCLGQILHKYKDGLLLVEDINKYISSNMNMELVGGLATIRQKGVDLITHYQMISKAANPALVGFTNFYRIHKTSDSPYTTSVRERLQEKFEIVAIAYEMVRNRYMNYFKKYKKKTYYSLTTDNDLFKIRGNFTKDEAIQGIRSYISKDVGVIDARLRQKDHLGNFIYKDYAHAYSSYEKELYDMYF